MRSVQVIKHVGSKITQINHWKTSFTEWTYNSGSDFAKKKPSSSEFRIDNLISLAKMCFGYQNILIYFGEKISDYATMNRMQEADELSSSNNEFSDF